MELIRPDLAFRKFLHRSTATALEADGEAGKERWKNGHLRRSLRITLQRSRDDERYAYEGRAQGNHEIDQRRSDNELGRIGCHWKFRFGGR